LGSKDAALCSVNGRRRRNRGLFAVKLEKFVAAFI
jgi:hypothetical protein